MSFSSTRKLDSSYTIGAAAPVVGSFTFMSEPIREDVLLVELEEDDWVNLLLILCIILQNVNKNNKTRGGLAVSHPGSVVLGVRNIF
jgi:hypothetical protein